MVYLEPGDYVRYGLDEETPDALVAAASALVDAFCRRASLGVTTCVERLRFARDGRTLRLSYGPVIAITACRTRLRRLRPDRQALWPFTQLQMDAMTFGLGGAWNTMDPGTIAIASDGEADGRSGDHIHGGLQHGARAGADGMCPDCAQRAGNARAEREAAAGGCAGDGLLQQHAAG